MNKSQSAKLAEAAALDPLWQRMREEVTAEAEREPILASFLYASVLNHSTFEASLCFLLAGKLESAFLPAMLTRELISDALAADPSIARSARADVRATQARDPAATTYAEPFLYYKGFHALQAYRAAHWLWHL